jgi:hypothetical protein
VSLDIAFGGEHRGAAGDDHRMVVNDQQAHLERGSGGQITPLRDNGRRRRSGKECLCGKISLPTSWTLGATTRVVQMRAR